MKKRKSLSFAQRYQITKFLEDHQELIRHMTTAELVTKIKRDFGIDVGAQSLCNMGDEAGVAWRKRRPSRATKDIRTIAAAVANLHRSLDVPVPSDLTKLIRGG
ncbi:MAG: hypothetical protein KME67_03955 [Candidatus Thiodiazotropha sp. (ex Codakia orbicularis)]|nr:hypothetical protein [Candidatus Thiodiazotropha sp. (ex Codakia orbicularis)]